MRASHDDLPFLIILCTCIRWRHDRRNCFTPTVPIGPFPIQLPNGAIVKVEVASTGREDARFDVKQFQPVADAILVPRGYANEGVVQTIAVPIQKVRLKKATVKFGMALAIV
jgi:hypothetical protein